MKKIKQVEVNKLFGYAKNNYTVKLLENEPLTFIYAFNGIGKTTLFRLIDAAIKRKMTVLDSIIFESIKITFDTDESFTVKKMFMKPFDQITMGELPKQENDYYFPIVFEWHTPGKDVIVGKHFFLKERSEEISALLKENFDSYSKLPYSWKTNKGIRQIPLSIFYKKPIVEEFIDRREIENNLLRVGVDLLFANKDYNRIAKANNPRLESDDARFYTSVSYFENYYSADVVPYEISDVINKVSQRQIEINTMSDISFKQMGDPTFSSSIYDKEIKYVYFELPDKTSIIEKQIQHLLNNENSKILYMLKDSKLSYKEYIEKKVNLFEEVINTKACLTDKNIHINRETGKIEIKLDFEEGGSISPEKLSSGEKNVLLLYFHLVFLIPDSYPAKSTYIEIIDEPEVSMHPDWLISFIENLHFINENLGRGDNIQFIVATHSPAITYANSNLMVEMRRA